MVDTIGTNTSYEKGNIIRAQWKNAGKACNVLMKVDDVITRLPLTSFDSVDSDDRMDAGYQHLLQLRKLLELGRDLRLDNKEKQVCTGPGSMSFSAPNFEGVALAQ